MARVDIKPVMVKLNGATPEGITFTAGEAGDANGFRFDFHNAGDNKLVILTQGAGKLTLKAGATIQGVKDQEIDLKANDAIRIDTGRFIVAENEYADGTAIDPADKNYVIAIPDSATVKVALIQLP